MPFELIALKLDGDQFAPEFLEISPFHHIPVLVDDDFSRVESQAILDYLEAKYPTPPLHHKDPQIQAWCDCLQRRPSWQETQVAPEAIAQLKAQMQARRAKIKE